MLSDSADMRWFAMRATYGRNVMAQRLLELHQIESFVPMRKRTVKVGRRIKTDLVPVVRDLIFVHAEREHVQEAKGKIAYLHYITHHIEGRNTPVEVPEEQMQQFIAVCNEMDDMKRMSPIWLSSSRLVSECASQTDHSKVAKANS